MAKPVKFALKGEGLVEVSSADEKEYVKALGSGEDMIKVCVKSTAFNIFPIMRKQLFPNDPAFMVSGGFEVERIGKGRKFTIRIDGVVSTESLKKKDIDAIVAGTAICTLDGVGTRDNWYVSCETSNDEIGIAVAPKA